MALFSKHCKPRQYIQLIYAVNLSTAGFEKCRLAGTVVNSECRAVPHGSLTEFIIVLIANLNYEGTYRFTFLLNDSMLTAYEPKILRFHFFLHKIPTFKTFIQISHTISQFGHHAVKVKKQLLSAAHKKYFSYTKSELRNF
jgi:hypothetical protein